MQNGIRLAPPSSAMLTMKGGSRQGKSKKRIFANVRLLLADIILFSDSVSVILCGIGAALLQVALSAGYDPSVVQADDLTRVSIIGALLSPIMIRERKVRHPDMAAMRLLVRRVAMLIAVVLVVALATRLIVAVPSLWVAGWLGSTVVAMGGTRMIAAALLRWVARRFGGERIAVVGSGTEAEWLRSTLRRAKSAGIELVRPSRRAVGTSAIVADLIERGRRGEIDRVVLALSGLANENMRQIAHTLKALQIEVASLYPMLGAGTPQHTTEIAEIPLFLVTRRPQWGHGGMSKQVMDRCLALALLFWMTPLLLLIALAVRLDSPGPVLFRQRRHGLNGTEFDIYKFRTMRWRGQGVGSGAAQTGRKDSRVTRIGAFLRKSSLDEVPQLLNVLNGTMSVVGPRPHPTVMRTEERLGDEITPDYPHRHRVKPGITGWAQVNGLRGATETAEQLRQRIEHDNYYIENCGIM